MSIAEDKELVAFRDVSVTFGGPPVLEGVTASVSRGEYLGVIGPNGGGKTTLLRLMLGLLEPSSGTVERRLPRSRIGYVPQRLTVEASFPATVREVVESGRTPSKGVFVRFTKTDRVAVDRALARANVAALAERRLGTLSGGERQRVMIARALCGEPELLALDEPSTGVDVEHQEAFYAFLRELHDDGLTVVMVSHDVDVIAHEVQRVLCLNRHLVCHGAPDDVMHKFEHYGH